MNNFKITIRKETFYINKGESVIGDIFFSFGDWCFPSKKWDDFVVIILFWLAQGIVRLNFDSLKPVEVDFMEGDFKTSFLLNSKKECIVSFIEGEKLDGDKEVVQKTVTVPFEEVKSEVRKACEVLLHMKETKELDFEKDYEELKESYELLCKC